MQPYIAYTMKYLLVSFFPAWSMTLIVGPDLAKACELEVSCKNYSTEVILVVVVHC